MSLAMIPMPGSSVFPPMTIIEPFLSRLRELGGELERVIITKPRRKRSDAYRIRVRRGPAYWRAAGIMIGTNDKPGQFFDDFGLGAIMVCSAGQFMHHLKIHLQSQVDNMWEEHMSECEAVWKLRREKKVEAERQRNKEAKAAEFNQWLRRQYPELW